MKSGLEGRNNRPGTRRLGNNQPPGLNEVRPRRPEQVRSFAPFPRTRRVSMKSGLEGRNNSMPFACLRVASGRLNEVRPRRPEQALIADMSRESYPSLNEVRPRRPEQYYAVLARRTLSPNVSMKSGLEGRNNQMQRPGQDKHKRYVSMKSGLEGRNNEDLMNYSNMDRVRSQ